MENVKIDSIVEINVSDNNLAKTDNNKVIYDSCENMCLKKNPSSDFIAELIGDYGIWQFLWTFILALFQFPTTFHIFTFVFQTLPKDFWCARPDYNKTIDIELWRNLTQPNGPCFIENLIPQSNQDLFYKRFNFITKTFLNLTKCEKFEYSNDDIGETIISEWNLVCDRKNLISSVEMSFLAGAAFGSVTSGWLSDKFGRRKVLIFATIIQTCFGTMLAFSKSLVMFMVLRVIIGFASMTVTVVGFVLVVELVSGKWRTIIGILNILPVAISYAIASVIAYLTRDWRLMQLVISVPEFLLLLTWFWLPESPRWLLARGRVDELKRLIEIASWMNKRKTPMNYEKYLEMNPKENINTNSEPFFVVFNKTYRRTTCLNLIIWFCAIVLYFGLTLHLSNLGGNVYINTIIASGLEGISICFSIYVVLKLGLRTNLILYMLTAGLACLLVNVVPPENSLAVVSLAIVGKCTTGATNAIIAIFTAKQYPTVIRNFGVGMGNFASGLGLIVIPYLWLLEHIQTFLPMTLMGSFGIIGAIALMLMKEPNDVNYS